MNTPNKPTRRPQRSASVGSTHADCGCADRCWLVSDYQLTPTFRYCAVCNGWVDPNGPHGYTHGFERTAFAVPKEAV